MSFRSLIQNQSLLFYFSVTLLIRLPFFFRDYIDRDESTFILMGQSWVEGFLPYTQLWDLKPPLVFLFFASIIYIFGKSFIAIRLAGVVVIALTAVVLGKIGKELGGDRMGFWAGLLYIFFSSLFGSLQGVMSEHLAMSVFVLAFWCLYKANQDRLYLVAAILFGMALMFRLNLAYPVVAVFMYHLFFNKLDAGEIFTLITIGGFGGLVVPFLTWIPYIITDQPEVWWNAVIMASLSYDQADLGQVFNALLEAIPFLAIFLFSIYKRKALFKVVSSKRMLQFIWVVTGGMLFMLIKSGKVNGHYLIQLFPFIILLALTLIFSSKLTLLQRIKPYIWVILLLMPVEAYVEYFAVGKNWIKTASPFNGEGITVPKYIKANYPEDVAVFFLDYHIGYWLLDKQPPTKIVTHPSNLMRPSNYPYVEGSTAGPMEELQKIMERKRPNLIISRSEHISFAPKTSPENQYFQSYIQQHYTLVHQDGRALVYELRD